MDDSPPAGRALCRLYMVKSSGVSARARPGPGHALPAAPGRRHAEALGGGESGVSAKAKEHQGHETGRQQRTELKHAPEADT